MGGGSDWARKPGRAHFLDPEAKAGSSSYPRPNLKISTRKLIAGSKCSLMGKFPRAFRMNRLRFQWESVYLGLVSTRKLIAGSKSCDRARMVEKTQKMKVIRMKFSILENVPIPRGSILELGRASQLPYRAKIKKSYQHLINSINFPIFPIPYIPIFPMGA